jgi:hypothetical protein
MIGLHRVSRTFGVFLFETMGIIFMSSFSILLQIIVYLFSMTAVFSAAASEGGIVTASAGGEGEAALSSTEILRNEKTIKMKMITNRDITIVIVMIMIVVITVTITS